MTTSATASLATSCELANRTWRASISSNTPAAKIDGKQVGKIALVGRGATAEVPDAKAGAVVAALDGATFGEKPVRARFAGKGDFTDADHFGNLSALLDLEAKAEQEEARRRAQAEEGSPVGDGTTLTKLALRDADLVQHAHREAATLLDADPQLLAAEHRAMRERLMRSFGEELLWRATG